MLRVIRREGAISLAVWGKSGLNSLSYAVTDVVSRYIEAPPRDAVSDVRNSAGELEKLPKEIASRIAQEVQWTLVGSFLKTK
jgi:hypothetical protein